MINRNGISIGNLIIDWKLGVAWRTWKTVNGMRACFISELFHWPWAR